jgi:hypothetical protein
MLTGGGLSEFFKNENHQMRGRIGFEVEIDMPGVFYNIRKGIITPIYKTNEDQYKEIKIDGTDIYISGDFAMSDENMKKVYDFTNINRKIMGKRYNDVESVFPLNDCELLFLSPDKGTNDYISLSNILEMKKNFYKTIVDNLSSGIPSEQFLKPPLLEGFFFVVTDNPNIIFGFKPNPHTNLFDNAKIQMTFDLYSIDFARMYDIMVLHSTFRDIEFDTPTVDDDYRDAKLLFESSDSIKSAASIKSKLPQEVHQYVMILIYIFITSIRFSNRNGTDGAKYIKSLLLFVMRSDVDEVMTWILEDEWTLDMKENIKVLLLSIYENGIKKGMETQNYDRWFILDEGPKPKLLSNEVVNDIVDALLNNMCDYLGVKKIPMQNDKHKPASIKIEARLFDDDIQYLEREQITEPIKKGKLGAWQEYTTKVGSIMPNRQTRLHSNRPYGGGKRKTVKRSRRKKSGGKRKTKRNKI